MRSPALIAGLMLAGCSQSRPEPAAGSKELIPAEWTVSEDTSAAGEVTTASVQLPAAREISGLVSEGESRLVLRCFDGRMQAFIDTVSVEPAGSQDTTAEGDLETAARMVPIQLDSAPACE